MNSLILCDLDGTLIDSREDLAAGVNLMRADFGLPKLSVKSVTSFVGNGVRKLVERALADSNIEAEEALPIFKRHYRENMFVKTALYPTVREGLEIIHEQGLKIALTSNKPTEACREILIHFGIEIFFDLILGGSGEYPLKPAPSSIFLALEKTESALEKSWIIGDNYTDLEAGRRAGIKRCFALYGFGKREKEEYDLAVKTFAEFADFLVKEKDGK